MRNPKFSTTLESLVTSATDENSNSSSFSYDDAMRLITATNAKSEVTTYAYDNLSQVTGITNAKGYTRSYEYTDRGEVKKLTMPDGAIEQWSYDGNGNTTAYTNPLTQVISYVYDNASRLTTVDYPTGTDTSLTYDDADRMTQMVDASGTTTWTYNTAYELTRLATPQGQIDYTYDDAGRPYTMVQQGVGTTTYTFDDASRLISLVNPFSETTSFAYDDASRLTRKTFSSGAYEAYGYDNRSRVTSIDLKNSSNTVLASHGYTFDAVSNVLTRTDDGVCTTFTYDVIDQLLSESRTGYSASYTYDANGNRLTKTLNGVVQTYVNDAGDKLTGIWQGLSQVKAFAYDAAGRRATMTASGVTTNFSYDYEDNLTSVSVSGGATDTYGYNGRGLRISENSSLGNLSLFRGGTSGGARLLGDGLASFTPGAGERRSSNTTNYSGDGSNYTTQLNSSQQITATRQYDAFGNITSSSGTWTGPFGAGGRIGGETFADNGLIGKGSRVFDPTVGRGLATWWRGASQSKGVSKGLNPPNPRPKVVIIMGYGADSADWELFYYYRNAFEAAGYDCVPMIQPDNEQVARALDDDAVDGIIYIGHGGKGAGAMNGHGGVLTPDLVKRARGKRRRLRFVVLESCDGFNDASINKHNTVREWNEVCDEFVAYVHTTWTKERNAYLGGQDDFDEWAPPKISFPPRRGPLRPGPRPWIRSPQGGRGN